MTSGKDDRRGTVRQDFEPVWDKQGVVPRSVNCPGNQVMSLRIKALCDRACEPTWSGSRRGRRGVKLPVVNISDDEKRGGPRCWSFERLRWVGGWIVFQLTIVGGYGLLHSCHCLSGTFRKGELTASWFSVINTTYYLNLRKHKEERGFAIKFFHEATSKCGQKDSSFKDIHVKYWWIHCMIKDLYFCHGQS